MALRRQLTEQERFEMWAVKRIMNEKDCDIAAYLKCIPSSVRDCKICYQKHEGAETAEEKSYLPLTRSLTDTETPNITVISLGVTEEDILRNAFQSKCGNNRNVRFLC